MIYLTTPNFARITVIIFFVKFLGVFYKLWGVSHSHSLINYAPEFKLEIET